MTRIINPDNVGKERKHLTKAVVVAIRELAKQTGPGEESRDLAAFLVLALRAIANTIDVTVVAWEKRGYWLKADKFMMEWAWSEDLAQKLYVAIFQDDWEVITTNAAKIAHRLEQVNVSPKHRLGSPWKGAYTKLCKTDKR